MPVVVSRKPVPERLKFKASKRESLEVHDGLTGVASVADWVEAAGSADRQAGGASRSMETKYALLMQRTIECRVHLDCCLCRILENKERSTVGQLAESTVAPCASLAFAWSHPRLTGSPRQTRKKQREANIFQNPAEQAKNFQRIQSKLTQLGPTNQSATAAHGPCVAITAGAWKDCK
ncbi:hypothetical protein BDV19DRAFT_52749 [Aspergillus venezuelensis]